MASPCAWILVPGWGADETAFDAVRARLPGVAVRVAGWDALCASGPGALDAAARDLGPGPVGLAGWSLGALLALSAAMAAPDRWAALALVSATARFTGDGEGHPGAEPRSLRAMAARLVRDPAPVLRAFAASAATPDGGEAAETWWSAQAGRFAREALGRGLDALASLDLRGGQGALRLPVRLLHGEADAVVPAAAGAALAAAVPGARLRTLPGRGHALPFTAPAEVAALLAGPG